MIRHHRITSGWLCESRCQEAPVLKPPFPIQPYPDSCKCKLVSFVTYESDITAGRAPALKLSALFPAFSQKGANCPG